VTELIFFDYVLLFILVVSGVTSLFRGFFREALSLASWLVAGWVAWRFGIGFSGWLEAWLSDGTLRLWVARAVLFVLVLLAGGLLGRLAGILMVSTGLTGTDRALGVVFGLGRGVIVCGLLLTVLQFMGFASSAWWQESKLIPYAAPVVDIIKFAAEDGLDYIDSMDMPEIPEIPGMPELPEGG
jgi:membrane protein required for colicin V production